MIWIIGGTSEAREFLSGLKDTDDIIITVTTQYGKSLIQDAKVITGRMNAEEMVGFIEGYGIGLIIDMSHPFALEVSSNAIVASNQTGTRYIRYIRNSAESEDAIIEKSMDDLLSKIDEITGNILFTTGSKDIPKFERVRGESRHTYRILPLVNSLKIAEEAGVSADDVICMKGPFTKEFNIAMIENFGIEYMVMKESGENSGFLDKIEACREMGVKPIVLKRTEEFGIDGFDDLKRVIVEYRKKS
ncbi:precorrin-6A reductase [Microaceticoccus formicicus]|uniref:precorrin-6A reductase n=1 Tax=Microaceticoccus formicicus TaxID=3118105 RepID=UPI003CCFF6DA|nr:precorrin-6A reductase [Peptoniphilaceae bacterium AMB_02]